MDEPLSGQAFRGSINLFYENLLGYKPENTSIKNISEKNWKDYVEKRGLNSNSSGIYLPRNQTVIVKEENLLSLFHEYFGHGLYCEQNLIGRKLVDLEKKLLEEEKEEFFSKKFNSKDLQKFRQENLTFQELEIFRQENLGKCELFAIWTEYLLSKEFGLKNKFERKYDFLSGQEKEAIDSVINFSTQYGNLATMYTQGMARRTTTKRVEKLLEEVYGKEKIKNSKLILLTGSKKPFSDIDLFASSNQLKTTKNSWLDLVAFDEINFEKGIELFDVQLTHSIVNGEIVIGNMNYLQEKRKQLQEQLITEEAIAYNFTKSLEQKRLALMYSKNSEERKIGLSYSETYLANALALKHGKRLFAKENLLLYLYNEKFIELKRGII